MSIQNTGTVCKISLPSEKCKTSKPFIFQTVKMSVPYVLVRTAFAGPSQQYVLDKYHIYLHFSICFPLFKPGIHHVNRMVARIVANSHLVLSII